MPAGFKWVSTELNSSVCSQPQKVEESFCPGNQECTLPLVYQRLQKLKNNSLGFIHFILQSVLLHVPKGSTREPDTWRWLGTLPSSLPCSGEFGSSELTYWSDSKYLGSQWEKPLVDWSRGLDHPYALTVIFLEASSTWPKLRKTLHWLPSALDQILCMSWISVML